MKKKIDVRIPYEPEGKLGWDYNRIMRETQYEWVLTLDHDVLLLNPNWYHICQLAVEQHPNAGLFTCKTNVKHSDTGQMDPNAPPSQCIDDHQEYAKSVWDTNGMHVTPITKASGFFFLMSVKAWKSVGGFPGKGMFKEDWDYCRRIRPTYEILRLDGLYVYHMKKRVGTWIEGQSTTKEMKNKEVKK